MLAARVAKTHPERKELTRQEMQAFFFLQCQQRAPIGRRGEANGASACTGPVACLCAPFLVWPHRTRPWVRAARPPDLETWMRVAGPSQSLLTSTRRAGDSERAHDFCCHKPRRRRAQAPPSKCSQRGIESSTFLLCAADAPWAMCRRRRRPVQHRQWSLDAAHMAARSQSQRPHRGRAWMNGYGGVQGTGQARPVLLAWRCPPLTTAAEYPHPPLCHRTFQHHLRP